MSPIATKKKKKKIVTLLPLLIQSAAVRITVERAVGSWILLLVREFHNATRGSFSAKKRWYFCALRGTHIEICRCWCCRCYSQDFFLLRKQHHSKKFQTRGADESLECVWLPRVWNNPFETSTASRGRHASAVLLMCQAAKQKTRRWDRRLLKQESNFCWIVAAVRKWLIW